MKRKESDLIKSFHKAAFITILEKVRKTPRGPQLCWVPPPPPREGGKSKLARTVRTKGLPVAVISTIVGRNPCSREPLRRLVPLGGRAPRAARRVNSRTPRGVESAGRRPGAVLPDRDDVV